MSEPDVQPQAAVIARATCPICRGATHLPSMQDGEPDVPCPLCRAPNLQPSAREPQPEARRATDRTPDDVILAGVGGGIAGFLFALIVVGVVRVFG